MVSTKLHAVQGRGFTSNETRTNFGGVIYVMRHNNRDREYFKAVVEGKGKKAHERLDGLVWVELPTPVQQTFARIR